MSIFIKLQPSHKAWASELRQHNNLQICLTPSPPKSNLSPQVSKQIKPNFVHDVAWCFYHPAKSNPNLFLCLQIWKSSHNIFQTHSSVAFVLLADNKPLFSRNPNLNPATTSVCTAGIQWPGLIIAGAAKDIHNADSQFSSHAWKSRSVPAAPNRASRFASHQTCTCGAVRAEARPHTGPRHTPWGRTEKRYFISSW